MGMHRIVTKEKKAFYGVPQEMLIIRHMIVYRNQAQPIFHDQEYLSNTLSAAVHTLSN